MKHIFGILTLFCFAATATAQENATDTSKKGHTISIGSNGIKIDEAVDSIREEKAFEIGFAGLDIGINTLRDNSNYASAAAQAFLNVDPALENENLFSLRTGKSINVNFWPVMFQQRLAKGENQKVYLSSGIGLQMYNFRFNKNISYLNNTQPEVYMDSVAFTKNKLGLTYLSIPLSLTFKTRLAKDAWLVYGFGITGGYRIASWTKQVSGDRGKQKNHDKYNFNDFNSCVTAELGLDGYFRLYASYQLTALHENALDQHPFCIGIRLLGI